MAWYTLTAYAPPTSSGPGTLGAVGGGWTDPNSQWRTDLASGGVSVIETPYTASSPWANAQILRIAAAEQAQNARVRVRWLVQASGQTPAYNSAPWVIFRGAPNTTNNQINGVISRVNSLWYLTAGSLSGTQLNGAGVTNYAVAAWYDTEWSLSGTTLTEKTTTVSDPINSAFGGGTTVTNNTYTIANYTSGSGYIGLFSYQPTLLQIASFNSASDTPASALNFSPASASGTTGTPLTFTLGVNGAQNGGAVTLSDGGAGGTFSPASVTLAPGTSATQTFTYTPTRSGSITVTAASTALTGASLAATAAISISAGPATALALAPATQSTIAGNATGAFTVSVNGSLAAATTVSLSDGGAGGAFSPTSISLASGSGSSGTFTYTPVTGAPTGNITLTATASGLTAATAATVVTAQATALAISPASQNVSAGVASGNYTVSLTSGGLASATTITLSDGSAGGTFTPSSLSLTAGAGSTATFTYTPATGTTGTKTLTASATGLTSASAAVVVSAATILSPTNASIVVSPFNWVTGLANTTTSDNSALRTWNTGAYLRVYVTGTTSLNIIFGASSTSANFIYQIDDGLPSSPTACLNNGSYTVPLPDTGAHFVTFTLYSISQIAGRWAGTLAVTINGFQLGSGGAGASASRGARNLLIYGDSITEGTQSHDGSDGMTTGFAYIVAESHRRQGWEYGIKGAGFSGYTVTVPSANGGQPPAWTIGNDSNSSWNKIDGSGVSGAAITTGTIGGASERFLTPPDLILDVWGTNDGLQGVADATVQATVTGFFQRLRVAAPNAVILTVIPFGGYKRAAIQAAAASLADAKLLVIDPKTDARMTATGYCGNLLTGASSGQAVHPWSLGSANLAALLLRQIDASYVPFAVARSFGSAA